MEKPLEETDGLKIENWKLKVMISGMKAQQAKQMEQDALAQLNALLQEMQQKYETQGWDFDPDRMVWVKNDKQ